MSLTTTGYARQIADYVHAVSLVREPAVMAKLREVTATLPMAEMQISVEQGLFMSQLAAMLGARRTIEVGTFTGYSALAVARMLPPDGQLVACDVSREWTTIARRFWKEAGVDERIDLRLGPAARTLAAMVQAGEQGRFDFAFIDADKGAYPRYYDLCLELVRGGGVIAIDNAFLDGGVLDGTGAGPVVRDLTRRIFDDDSVDASLVPIGDGLLLARKR
jgi:predicted O-methyltransferase YrrM